MPDNMDAQAWKNISQIVVFFATAIGLLGSIGIWHFGSQLDEKRRLEDKVKATELELRTAERDRAIAQIQSISSLNAELDTPVTSAFLRVFLTRGYAVTEMQDFRVFFELSPFDAYYELQISECWLQDEHGNKEPLWGFNTLAGHPKDFAKRPMRQIGPAGEPPPGARLTMFAWNLYLAVRPKIKLRDLHHGAIRVAFPTKYLPAIDHLDLLVNDWIIYTMPANDPFPNSRGNPVVDVPNKDDYVTLQFSDMGIGPRTFGVIDLFDGPKQKAKR